MVYPLLPLHEITLARAARGKREEWKEEALD